MADKETGLLFTTRVDLSGLNQGLAEAKTTVTEAAASFEGLTTAQRDSELAVDSVIEGFSHLDEFLDKGITQEQAYWDYINKAADAYERQLAVKKQIFEQTTNEIVAQTALAELAKTRSQQEMNSNRAMLGRYADAAGNTPFPVESNADYAERAAGVSNELAVAQGRAAKPVAAPVEQPTAQSEAVAPVAQRRNDIVGKNVELSDPGFMGQDVKTTGRVVRSVTDPVTGQPAVVVRTSAGGEAAGTEWRVLPDEKVAKAEASTQAIPAQVPAATRQVPEEPAAPVQPPRQIPEELPRVLQPTRNQIKQRAEQLWAENGFTDGHAEEDWIRAEQQLKEEANTKWRTAREKTLSLAQTVSNAPQVADEQTTTQTRTGIPEEARRVLDEERTKHDLKPIPKFESTRETSVSVTEPTAPVAAPVTTAQKYTALEEVNRKIAADTVELRQRNDELANSDRITSSAVDVETNSLRAQEETIRRLNQEENTLVRSQKSEGAPVAATTGTPAAAAQSAGADAAAEQADAAALTAKAQAAQEANTAIVSEAAATQQATEVTNANVSSEERKVRAAAAWDAVAGNNIQVQKQLSAAYYEAKRAGADETEAMEQAVASVTKNTAANEANATSATRAAAAQETAVAATQKTTQASGDAAVGMSRELAAMTAYEAATKNRKVNQEQLAAAYDKAIAAGRSQVEAAEQAVAATASATQANQENTNSLRTNTEEEERNAKATYNRAEAFGTARIAAGLFAGSLTGVEYGLARIAAASKTVGTALAAAMDVFIVAAMADMVIQLGKNIYEAFDLSGEGAYKAQRNIEELNLSLEKSFDQTELQIVKLQQEQAKLEKKPFQNGLALSLIEAGVAADQLYQKLDAAYKKEAQLLSLDVGKGGMAPSKLQWFFGQHDLHDETVMVGEHDRHMSEAKSLPDQLQENESYTQTLKNKRNELQESADLRKDLGPLSFTMESHEKEIAAIDHILRLNEKEKDNIQAQIDLQKQLGATEQARVNHQGAHKDPNVTRLKAIQDEFAEYRQGIVNSEGDFKPGQGASFWAKYLQEFKHGTDQARAVDNEYTRYVQENHQKLIESYKKLQEAEKHERNEVVEKSLIAMDEWVRRTAEDTLHTGERWAQYTKELDENTQIQQHNNVTLEEAAVKHDMALGKITQFREDMRLASLQAKDYADKLKSLKKELEDLQRIGANLRPGDKGYSENQTQQQGVKNKIEATTGQAAVSAITNHGKIEQDIVAPFDRAFKTINSDFMKAVDGIRSGTESVSRAFGKMGVDLVVQTEDALMKMALKWAEQEAKMLLLHVITNHMKVASDATAAAQGEGISKGAAAKEIFVDAKSAAAGAWKAVVGIPVVGPVLAPIAAATTFAGVMALAAFDVGGVIPGSEAVPILGHGGERVLTTGQTTTFDRMVNNLENNTSTTNRSNANITYSPTIHAYDARGLRGLLNAHADDLMDIVQNGIDSGALTPP